METETPSSRARPRAWLLGVLGLAFVGLIAYWMWPTAPPPLPASQPAARARNTRPAGPQTVTPEDLKVRLEALQTTRPDPGDVERNPFRFRPPPPPPPPPKLPESAMLPPPVAMPTPPPVPPIPLKFMGTVEGPGIKLAALTDCKGFTYAGREGEVIDGRYRLVRIQLESIVMEYLDGTGRTTIRKSGECQK